jgi:uncharacterized membrane protein
MYDGAFNLAEKGNKSWVLQTEKVADVLKKMGMTKQAGMAQGMARGMRKAAVQSKGLMGAFKAIAKFAPILGRAMGVAFGPVGWVITGIMMIADLISFIIKINSEVVSISKNMGISKDEARALRQELFRMSYASNNIKNTQQELLKTLVQIQDAWGVTVSLVGDNRSREYVRCQYKMANSCRCNR